MSMQFLSDFAHSKTPASECIRNFSDSCRGKKEEREDIESNREHYEILSSSLTLRRVSVAAGGATASMSVACSFRSKVTKCPPPRPGDPPCAVGSIDAVQGDCNLTGVYELKRWWLCDSRFENGVVVPSMRAFFGTR